jgi:hypothetical protein
MCVVLKICITPSTPKTSNGDWKTMALGYKHLEHQAVRNQTPTLHAFRRTKPALNNKDILNVEYVQQCKIKFEPPRYKRDNFQTANDTGTQETTATWNQDTSNAAAVT